MVWNRKSSTSRSQVRSQLVLSILLMIVLLIIGFASWVFFLKDDQAVDTEPIDTSVASGTETIEVESTEQEKFEFDSESLQEAVSSWAQVVGEENASVVISSTDGTVLAAHNPDEVYFAASIYKLYVAYEGYRQVDLGEVDPDEEYLNGFTRLECLDKMIRESDSPCAEKLWVELGKESLNETLKTYGIANTSMTAIQTTAKDAAIMLARIARGEGLSDESRQALLLSMKNQIFRDTLNKGFSDNVTVYNKIGFRELVEYHDTAIVQVKSGEQIIVSVLTESVGTKNIVNLAEMLEPIIQQ